MLFTFSYILFSLSPLFENTLPDISVPYQLFIHVPMYLLFTSKLERRNVYLLIDTNIFYIKEAGDIPVLIHNLFSMVIGLLAYFPQVLLTKSV